MLNLVENLHVSEEVVSHIWSLLVSTYNDAGDISTMLMEYTKESQKREQYINSLVRMYESEIVRLKNVEHGNQLNMHQKAVIKDEMKILESVCDKGIRSGSSLDSCDNISPSLFKEFLEEVNEKCPLVHGMLEALVISNPVSRNILKTNAHKMLCGLQTLGFISNMRN